MITPPLLLTAPRVARLSHPYLRALLMLASFLAAASLLRLSLYLGYGDDFKSLSAAQVWASFVVGLRFDLSMAIAMAVLPLLFLLLPFGWSHHRYWQRTWQWSVYLLLLAFVFMMCADILYFGYVHRHVGSEINALSSDLFSMLGVALRQYALALLGFAAFALALAWVWHRLFAILPQKPATPWVRLLALTPLFFGMLILARGGIDGKPLSVGEAFFSDSAAQGYLAMNGAFAVSRALLESPPPLQEFMPPAQAASLLQHHLAGDAPVFTEPDYPLTRTFHTIGPTRKPNVVVVMLESWGAQHIDALRRLNGQKPIGATPNFDALAQQGMLYKNFYANGQRSIQGAAAVLASQLTLPGMPFLGEGLEQNRLSFMGQLARSQGYETFFLQSSERGSLRFDAVAARAGFTQYLGAEDIPNLHAIAKPAATWGTWDHNTLQAANKLFAASKTPFMGFVFTSTTHTPWMVPDAKFQKFKAPTPKAAFLNSLVYADWALGELIAAAKRDGYYDNTVFVLVADHADEFIERAESIPNQYHIPLLLVGPGISQGSDGRVGSQVDILPTLIELCGWQVQYAGMGRSLLSTAGDVGGASLGVRGSTFDWIDSKGWASHNLERPLGHSEGLTPAEVLQMQRLLLASYQTLSTMQAKNSFLPPGR